MCVVVDELFPPLVYISVAVACCSVVFVFSSCSLCLSDEQSMSAALPPDFGPQVNIFNVNFEAQRSISVHKNL